MARYGDQDGKDKPARKQGKVGNGDSAEFRGYINIELSKEEKARHNEWAASGALWDVFETVVGDGVNIAVRREARTSGYLASATQRNERSPNAGLCVTARGGEALQALSRLLYLLALLSHAERWEDVKPMADPDRW